MPSGEGLAVGITEPNPNFVWPAEAKPGVPPEFARWRDVLAELRPSIYRLVVEWAALQPRRGEPPAFELPQGGCLRDKPPCAGWGGLREQLRAVAAQQRATGSGRWQVLLVLAGTPEWAAESRTGCERDGGTARSRAVRRGALPAYADFIRAIRAVAREEGATIAYWSPWNEPNHPYGLSPQRRRCSREARSAAVERYVRVAQEMRGALEEGETLVLGELAGLLRRTEQATTVGEVVAGLPKDLLCAAPVFSQHAYVGGADPVDELHAALAARGCDREHAIWITETGAGGPRRGLERDLGTDALEGTCRRYMARLRRWHADPRVTTAIQYTLREDDRFPTGLVSTDLERAYPVLRAFRAWGGDRDPGDPPPSRPRC